MPPSISGETAKGVLSCMAKPISSRRVDETVDLVKTNLRR